MTSLATCTIEEFLDTLAARVPAPGGGATAALHAAQAAALLGMVGRYTTGPRHAESVEIVEPLLAATDDARKTALHLADADAAAFTAVTEAYVLPRTTPEETDRRRVAIAAALVGATRPPEAVIALADRLVTLTEVLLPVANRNVITDVAAATEAARAAATTARLTIAINLGGIIDPAVRARLAQTVAVVDDLCTRAATVERRVRDEIAG